MCHKASIETWEMTSTGQTEMYLQIRTSFVSPHDIHFVELGLHGNCQLWTPKKVCIQAEGEFSWRVFPSDSLLSTFT